MNLQRWLQLNWDSLVYSPSGSWPLMLLLVPDATEQFEHKPLTPCTRYQINNQCCEKWEMMLLAMEKYISTNLYFLWKLLYKCVFSDKSGLKSSPSMALTWVWWNWRYVALFRHLGFGKPMWMWEAPSPTHLFLWGFLKERVYGNAPNTFQDLWERMIENIVAIDEKTRQRMIQNCTHWEADVLSVLYIAGEHSPDIVFHT